MGSFMRRCWALEKKRVWQWRLVLLAERSDLSSLRAAKGRRFAGFQRGLPARGGTQDWTRGPQTLSADSGIVDVETMYSGSSSQTACKKYLAWVTAG